MTEVEAREFTKQNETAWQARKEEEERPAREAARIQAERERAEEQAKFATFLEEYKALCLKHGIFVGACGCCGSPWLTGTIHSEDIEDHLKHLANS